MHCIVHMCPGVSYLEKRWTDCAEIWCMVTDQLARRCTQASGGIHVQEHTCEPLFRISETAERIALKFGMLLEKKIS